jgi:hypothetical protein
MSKPPQHIPRSKPLEQEANDSAARALEQEANDSAAQVDELAQQLKQQKAKALEAQQALHAATIGMHQTAPTRRHTLSIAAN